VISRGDYLYDPFLGSGTTLIAAETVGRVWAVELDAFKATRSVDSENFSTTALIGSCS
jgi:tRNA G10  N-methylase Trm11